MDPSNKTELISYLKSHGLWAKHGLGQNFLVDKEVLDKIIEAAELTPDDKVIEVGPGVGTLTGELAKSAGKVIAVELDEKLAELLADTFGTVISTPRRLSGVEKSFDLVDCNIASKKDLSTDARDDKLVLINADILKVNIPELVGEKDYKVVANIPYYITSKIIQLFLTQENKPQTMVMLVQKEVAERICAKPGEMSVLSISVQAYGQPEIVGIVPKESFFPSPNVDSAILRIRITGDVLGITEKEEKEFFRLVHIGFASRRKTLVNNLAAGLHIDKTEASDIIKKAGFDPNVRAQELSVEDWINLLAFIVRV